MVLPAVGHAKTWMTSHRTVLLGGAVGGALLLGLRARGKAKAGSGPAGSNAGAGPMAPAGSGTAATYTGAGTYDSTANDLYNALEPQIEALSRQIETMGLRPGPVATPAHPKPPAGIRPRPAPKPKPKPKPVKHGRPPVVVRRPPAPRPRPGRTYTVRRGDNLSSIAARNKVGGGWQRLYGANRGVVGGNPNTIRAGEVLRLP